MARRRLPGERPPILLSLPDAEDYDPLRPRDSLLHNFPNDGNFESGEHQSLASSPVGLVSGIHVFLCDNY